MSVATIRTLSPGDYDAWLPLWTKNNLGQEDKAVTAATWAKLTDSESPVRGKGAFLHDGDMAGLVHYILHPVTGSLAPAAYMQDLYVDTPFRRHGIAKQLVEAVANTGKREKWARLYWLAEGGNEAAQALYKNIGVRLDFSFHVMPL